MLGVSCSLVAGRGLVGRAERGGRPVQPAFGRLGCCYPPGLAPACCLLTCQPRIAGAATPQGPPGGVHAAAGGRVQSVGGGGPDVQRHRVCGLGRTVRRRRGGGARGCAGGVDGWRAWGTHLASPCSARFQQRACRPHPPAPPCSLFDCDFNQQLELGLAGRPRSVFDIESLDELTGGSTVAGGVRGWVIGNLPAKTTGEPECQKTAGSAS